MYDDDKSREGLLNAYSSEVCIAAVLYDSDHLFTCVGSVLSVCDDIRTIEVG